MEDCNDSKSSLKLVDVYEVSITLLNPSPLRIPKALIKDGKLYLTCLENSRAVSYTHLTLPTKA